MDKVNINIKPVSKYFVSPSYESEGASGMDLYACIKGDIVLSPMKRTLIPTGFAMSIPIGYEAQIRPRSGLALKYGITVLNTPGTIDSDYRGEVKVILINFGEKDFIITPKSRIAQMVINKVSSAQIKTTITLTTSLRDNGGFGSTGI